MEHSDELHRIHQFFPITDTIGTGGQPTRAQLPALKDAGFNAVINLATPSSPNFLHEEGDLLRKLGLDYLHIPIVWQSPALENAELFFREMQARKGQKIFIHCASNMRVSTLVFLYRVIHLNVPRDRAEADLHLIWNPDETWTTFINNVLAKFPPPATA